MRLVSKDADFDIKYENFDLVVEEDVEDGCFCIFAVSDDMIYNMGDYSTLENARSVMNIMINSYIRNLKNFYFPTDEKVIDMLSKRCGND